jgi:hypothetical protein
MAVPGPRYAELNRVRLHNQFIATKNAFSPWRGVRSFHRARKAKEPACQPGYLISMKVAAMEIDSFYQWWLAYEYKKNVKGDGPFFSDRCLQPG